VVARAVARRAVCAKAIRNAALGFSAGGVASVALVAMTRVTTASSWHTLIPMSLREWLFEIGDAALLAGPAALGVVVAIALAARGRWSDARAARETDARLGLHDGLWSALHLSQTSGSGNVSANDQTGDAVHEHDSARGLVALAIADGASLAARVDPRRVVTMPSPRVWAWPTGVGVIALAGAIVMALRVEPASNSRAQSVADIPAQTAMAALRDAKATIQSVAQNTPDSTSGTATGAADAISAVERELSAGSLTHREAAVAAAEQLQTAAEERDAAAKAIERNGERAADALRALRDRASREQPESNQGTSRNEGTRDAASRASTPLGKALEDGDAERVAAEVERLQEQLETLPPEEREAVAKELDALADRLKAHEVAARRSATTDTEGREGSKTAESENRPASDSAHTPPTGSPSEPPRSQSQREPTSPRAEAPRDESIADTLKRAADDVRGGSPTPNANPVPATPDKQPPQPADEQAKKDTSPSDAAKSEPSKQESTQSPTQTPTQSTNQPTPAPSTPPTQQQPKEPKSSGDAKEQSNDPRQQSMPQKDTLKEPTESAAKDSKRGESGSTKQQESSPSSDSATKDSTKESETKGTQPGTKQTSPDRPTQSPTTTSKPNASPSDAPRPSNDGSPQPTPSQSPEQWREPPGDSSPQSKPQTQPNAQPQVVPPGAPAPLTQPSERMPSTPSPSDSKPPTTAAPGQGNQRTPGDSAAKTAGDSARDGSQDKNEVQQAKPDASSRDNNAIPHSREPSARDASSRTPGLEELKHAMKAAKDTRGAAQPDREAAEKLREQARKTLEQLTPAERDELQKLAQELARESTSNGSQNEPRNNDQNSLSGSSDLGDPTLPGTAPGSVAGGATPQRGVPTSTATDEEIVRVRGSEAGAANRTIAEWMASPKKDASAASAIEDALQDAAHGGERAIEQQAVPARHAEFLKRVFKRYRDRPEPVQGKK